MRAVGPWPYGACVSLYTMSHSDTVSSFTAAVVDIGQVSDYSSARLA